MQFDDQMKVVRLPFLSYKAGIEYKYYLSIKIFEVMFFPYLHHSLTLTAYQAKHRHL